jgi:hypothetical protein
MSVLYAINRIEELAVDLFEKHNCTPTDRKKWIGSYDEWKQLCYDLSDDNLKNRLAYRLLESIETYTDSSGNTSARYRVDWQTVIDAVNLGSTRQLIQSNTDIEEYLHALDDSTTDETVFKVAKEVFDPDDEQLVGDESISLECYRGTPRQWMEYLLDCDDWYKSYCEDLDGEDLPTIHEWAVEQIKKHCDPWDGDMAYKRL